MILGISGLAGAGKDTVADFLKSHNWVKLSLADHLKRICHDVFEFTEDQLWGPSEKRNEPDERYPQTTHSWKFEQHSLAVTTQNEVNIWACRCGKRVESMNYPSTILSNKQGPCVALTPRYALQQLGTQWGRDCYDNVWIDYALRFAKQLDTDECKPKYSPLFGAFYPETPTIPRSLIHTPNEGVVIPDVRFKNEMNAIREAGGKVIRIKRPGKETPEWNHASETEQLSVPDEWFDHVLLNEGDLADLGSRVLSMMNKLKEGKNES